MRRKKRNRRKSSEIELLRNKLLQAVKKERQTTLTRLVSRHGSAIGIRNTPSDKNLAKRQLDILAKSGQITFKRHGRDLIAQSTAVEPAPAPVPALAKPTPAPPAPEISGEITTSELAVIKAYARQVEEFSKTLQKQIATLVRMVDRAARN